MSNEYVFERNQIEQEHLRLRLIEEALDPITVRHLERTGVCEDWHCLELGPGAGSMVKWLSTAVGQRGSVVAVDKNTTHIRNFSAPNISVIEADFLEVDLNLSLGTRYFWEWLMNGFPVYTRSFTRWTRSSVKSSDIQMKRRRLKCCVQTPPAQM